MKGNLGVPGEIQKLRVEAVMLRDSEVLDVREPAEAEVTTLLAERVDERLCIIRAASACARRTEGGTGSGRGPTRSGNARETSSRAAGEDRGPVTNGQA